MEPEAAVRSPSFFFKSLLESDWSYHWGELSMKLRSLMSFTPLTNWGSVGFWVSGYLAVALQEPHYTLLSVANYLVEQPVLTRIFEITSGMAYFPMTDTSPIAAGCWDESLSGLTNWYNGFVFPAQVAGWNTSGIPYASVPSSWMNSTAHCHVGKRQLTRTCFHASGFGLFGIISVSMIS